MTEIEHLGVKNLQAQVAIYKEIEFAISRLKDMMIHRLEYMEPIDARLFLFQLAHGKIDSMDSHFKTICQQIQALHDRLKLLQ